MVLHGGNIGKSERLRLTEPATGCHTDMHGCIRGNIYLAALDSTCGGTSECKVQVVQRMAFPAPLGEEMKCVHVCVPGSPALSACLQTVHTTILYILILDSLHK